MHLERLELQGFKTFANHTVLTFPTPTADSRGLTAIVGPNGSGKSNIADGIRWVLGEQSMKLLRSKKSEDVIFHGADKRGRSGFAEVAMLLNNADGAMPIEYKEVTITRRLYRDGKSEYLLNGSPVRLIDVQLLLARANFGEKHYSVIGQGMIDGILVLSTDERREFFEEATGVRPLEIKRKQSVAKLLATQENKREAAALLAEIEPRLRSLARSVKKLEERSNLETELHALQHEYYSRLWTEVTHEEGKLKAALGGHEQTVTKTKAELAKLEREFSSLEHAETASSAFLRMQKEYEGLLAERNKLREREFEVRQALAREAAAKGTGIPTEAVVAELSGMLTEDSLEGLRGRIKRLIDRILGRAPREAGGKLETELAALSSRLPKIHESVGALETSMREVSKNETTNREKLFGLERSLRRVRTSLGEGEAARSAVAVDLARVETRRASLEDEMARELRERLEVVKREVRSGKTPPEELRSRMEKFKYQLELIGGIDPEVTAEHGEIKTRVEHLRTNLDDLDRASADLEKLITDLDQAIDEQFNTAFVKIGKDFERFFKILFGGGTAKLTKAMVKEEVAEDLSEGFENQKLQTENRTFLRPKFEITISASPPGKKVRDIAALSGGEKAMTAIALVSAILAVNPSPFVVLDEVDAALDEANSIRFADIIQELSHQTQFVVITHNRATMEHAAILYGVTMGDDGASRMLSIRLEEAPVK